MSNNTKITNEERTAILHAFLNGDYATAQVQARRHGLAENYAWKLARARGLVPRTAKRWGALRESA